MADDNSSWRDVIKADELKEGIPLSREVDGKEVLLVRRKGKVCACGNSCPHYGAPLNEGLLHGDVITCPWHNSQFDVRTGKMLSPPTLDDLAVYEVREENGMIQLGAENPQNIEMPSGEDSRVFLILGAGAAATSAAEMLRREGFPGTIRMITAEKRLPYDRPTLSKSFLAGKSDADALPLRPEDFFSRLKIDVVQGRTVQKVLTEEHEVQLDDGSRVAYDKLLLASGGTPNTLPVPGSDMNGVFLLRTWDDAERIRTFLSGVEEVVLVGASFIAMELASGFITRGKKVHVVAPEKIPFASVLGEAVGKRLQTLHEENGVVFHLEHRVKEFSGSGKLEEVVLDDGSRISAGMAVIGIGVRPRVEYLEGTEIVKDGAVPVDSSFRTGVKDIYAAGDIASVPDPRLGKSVRIEHWTVAERHGQHAARAMLGFKEDYDELPFFWTMQHGTSLKYVGYAPGFDSVLFRGDVEQGNFLAGYYGGGKLLAAASIGMTNEVMALGELIRRGVSVSVSQFVDDDFSILDHLRKQQED